MPLVRDHKKKIRSDVLEEMGIIQAQTRKTRLDWSFVFLPTTKLPLLLTKLANLCAV